MQISPNIGNKLVQFRLIVLSAPLTGLHFWATGYCVSTVGLDEQRIRQQEKLESGQGELDLK